MKFVFYYIGLLLQIFLLAGCNHGPSARKSLLLSDSLTNQNQHDSALTVLKDMEQEVPDLTEEEQMHYTWNLAKAQYYTGQSMESDSLLPQAILFYKEKKDSAKANLAPLLEATYWQWKGNTPKVFQTIRDGILIAEQQGNVPLQSDLYFFKAQYQYDLRHYNDAIKTLQKALSIFPNIPPDKQHPILYLQAICYNLTGETNAGTHAYIHAIKVAKTSGNYLMEEHYLRNYAASLNRQGKPDKALECLRSIYKNNSPYSNAMVTVSIEMAHAFLLKHQLDSTEYYIHQSQKLLNGSNASARQDPSIRCLIYTLQQLVQYSKGGNPDMTTMGRYLDSISMADVRKNSSISQRMKIEISLLNRNNDLTAFKQRSQFWLFLIITILTISTSAIYIYLKKRQENIRDMEEQIEALNRLISDAGKAKETDQNNDAFFKKVLLQQLGILKAVATEPTTENQRLLYRLLNTSDNKEGENSETLMAWEDIYHTIDRIYHHFYTNVKTDFGQVLTEKELQTLCLIRAGFSTKEIGVVTHQSTAMVYMRKTAIRKKLGIDVKGDILSFINIHGRSESLL